MASDIMRAYQKWLEQSYTPASAKSPERKGAFTTSSGIAEPPLFAPRGDEAARYAEQLGFPGEYPFTRGVQPTMYRGRFWTMRQYAGFGTAEDANARYRYLLASGQATCARGW